MFHGHGVACSDFFALGLVVRFQVPAFVGSFFNCGNGFVDVVFTCTTNVAGRYVAVVVGCVAAQDGCQVHLGSIQLGFGRGFVRSGQWGAAQCGVGQSADNTFFTVNHDRFAAVRCVFADGDFLSQAEVDRFACTACGNDVLVFACVGNGVAQVDFFRRPVVRNDVQTFVQLFTNLVQCVLNGVYRGTRRTVGMIDGKVGLCDRTIRTNSRIQRRCQRFDLADVHSVGVFRTFGYVGNLVAAVVQSRLGQGYGIGSIGNGQTISRQYAVTCLQRIGSYTGQRNVVFQFDFNAVCTRFGNHIFVVAFNCQRFVQFFSHGRAAIAVKGNTFGIDNIFRIYAFLNLSFGGICKVKFVVGGFGLVTACRFSRIQCQLTVSFYAHSRFIGMNGIKCLITSNLRSNMGIIACRYDADFLAVGNGFIDGIGNISCGSKCIACRIRTDYAASTCCQRRFIDIERNGAVFVFGGRTCAINEVQRGIVFSQGFSIRTVDLYADVLQCAVGFCQRGFGFVRQIQIVGSDISSWIFRRRQFQTVVCAFRRDSRTFGIDGINRLTVRAVGFLHFGNIRTCLNLGFRGFDLFIACCVIICHAVSNVGNLVATVGESARSQAHRVAAGADGYAGTVNGRASSGYIAAKDCGSQAGQFFCQFDVQRVILVV